MKRIYIAHPLRGDEPDDEMHNRLDVLYGPIEAEGGAE